MRIKDESATKLTCDCCGNKIQKGKEFQFVVTMCYNNASYREPGEDCIGFEASNKGDYCLDCGMGFYNAFMAGMEHVQLVERYEKQHMTAAQESEWVKKWQGIE